MEKVATTESKVKSETAEVAEEQNNFTSENVEVNVEVIVKNEEVTDIGDSQAEGKDSVCDRKCDARVEVNESDSNKTKENGEVEAKENECEGKKDEVKQYTFHEKIEEIESKTQSAAPICNKNIKNEVPKSLLEFDRITNFESSSNSSCSSRSCSRERSPSVTSTQKVIYEWSPSPPETPTSLLSGDSDTSAKSLKQAETDVCYNTIRPRYKLVWEGDLQVCYLNHTRTVISKILSSKFLRRWESHRLYLNDSCISSKTPSGCLEVSIPYTALQEVYVVSRWDAGHKFCIRLVIADGSLLLQASNAYTRDQWYHSIIWKKNIFKYQNLLKTSTRPEVILKELKRLVDLAITTPLHDECVSHVPIEIASKLLVDDEDCWTVKAWSVEMISILAPLLENCPPSPEMCRFFSRHCIDHPRSSLVSDALTPIIHRILKHNFDFGKFLLTRKLVQDYIQALYSHNDGKEVLRKFVASAHGQNCGCPHPRVLPNLVSVCLAAVFSAYEIPHILQSRNEDSNETDDPSQLECYLHVFIAISEYDDWRPGLAQLLQPIPFPDEALANEDFIRCLMPVIRSIGTDIQCDVHQSVLGIREGKEGWFDVYCPSSLACVDDGKLWGDMLETLLNCCCKRKRFINQLIGKRIGACLLLALRDHAAAQTVLCLALEWNLLPEADQRLTVVTTLQSTESGIQFYSALCQRQLHLQELQQKGGPRKLTLPSRSTDNDVIRLLSHGAFGNLECLTLAFTHVTSACAEHIIKLPALRYLNLWATQFGDAGLIVISEHLPKLQVLNLCETPVSDKGIAALGAMTNLRKLNLNSTKLSPQTFETLKKKLPGLQELDIRYTEAW